MGEYWGFAPPDKVEGGLQMTVEIEKNGDVWTVIHDRSETRNAMDRDSARALHDAIDVRHVDVEVKLHHQVCAELLQLFLGVDRLRSVQIVCARTPKTLEEEETVCPSLGVRALNGGARALKVMRRRALARSRHHLAQSAETEPARSLSPVVGPRARAGERKDV